MVPGDNGFLIETREDIKKRKWLWFLAPSVNGFLIETRVAIKKRKWNSHISVFVVVVVVHRVGLKEVWVAKKRRVIKPYAKEICCH